MHHRQLGLTALVAVLPLLMPAAAEATTIVASDFAEMVAGSPLIVHGTVVDVRSQAIAGRGSIESVVTVAVVTPIAGPAAARVAFRVPNGEVGRYRRITVGAPEFNAGDEVILFLRGQPPALPMPFGLNQGVYRVTRSGGATRVTPVVPAAAGRVVRGDPARRPMTIEAFAQQVRAVLTNAGPANTPAANRAAQR
jgi:hypothetical protein